MMFWKAFEFNDLDAAAEILNDDRPSMAKKIGRRVKNFDDARWSRVAFSYVVAGNILKFTQNSVMGRYLLSTNNSILVEASPYDEVWGIGMNELEASYVWGLRGVDPSTWKGKNLLGFALMEARDAMRVDMLDKYLPL